MSNATKVVCKWLKCVEDISEFNESFIKSYNEECDEQYFLEVHFQYLENLHITFTMVCPFCLKEWKLKSWKGCSYFTWYYKHKKSKTSTKS